VSALAGEDVTGPERGRDKQNVFLFSFITREHFQRFSQRAYFPSYGCREQYDDIGAALLLIF